MNMNSDNGNDFVDWHEDSAAHVPQPARERLATNEVVREGFINILQHAAITLRADKAPTITNVRDAGTTAREHSSDAFYQIGGCALSSIMPESRISGQAMDITWKSSPRTWKLCQSVERTTNLDLWR
jgi:hypothetical protein